MQEFALGEVWHVCGHGEPRRGWSTTIGVRFGSLGIPSVLGAMAHLLTWTGCSLIFGIGMRQRATHSLVQLLCLGLRRRVTITTRQS